MKRKIGIMADCFQVDILEGIRKAAKLGADAVQIYVGGRGAVAERWTKDYRDTVRKTLQDSGLAVSAMCGDMGGHGFGLAKDNGWRIEETARMMALTRELGCDILTTHIGVIPPDSAHPRYAVLQDA
ncbi:MAG TPA: TIM barrel protein, partial [Clostridia bacterium]|nr:TIM barrel protein [Clostridia bacterium]